MVYETLSQKKKKKNQKKRIGGVTQGVGPEFKPQYCKKKKKRNNFCFSTYQKGIKLGINRQGSYRKHTNPLRLNF
jgi:hypothetical protein